MSDLKICPCGKTPTSLHIADAGQGGKWAYVSGDCCNEWEVEFRTEYYKLDSDECMKLAIEDWNLAPRGFESLQTQLKEANTRLKIKDDFIMSADRESEDDYRKLESLFELYRENARLELKEAKEETLQTEEAYNNLSEMLREAKENEKIIRKEIAKQGEELISARLSVGKGLERITELNKANEWISVEDRLPEDESEVYLYPPKEFDGIPTTYSGVLRRHESKKWWVVYGNGIVYNHDKVTHWKPIELPK